MASTIFNGNFIKTLKPNLSLFGAAYLLTGTVNPTSVATNAPPGSLYLNTSSGTVYKKNDSGTTTNWAALATAVTSPGDINETSFSAANNISSPANVTGLAFANATVRSAIVTASVYVNATTSLYEVFTLELVQNGSGWYISSRSTGDASGFIFTVTSAGQVQYVNNNYTGFSAATVKFRAITTSV